MQRLDSYLKDAGYFDSRQKARQAIIGGCVLVNGKTVSKVSYICSGGDEVVLTGVTNKYVSRGGYKLEKALDFFNLNVEGKKAIDVGASTGGFTHVLLQRNIGSVVCVDVGKGQLHGSIRADGRVKVFEGTDFRDIDPCCIADAALVVIDVSFISVKLLIEKINAVFKDAQIICLVKPQFECGVRIAKKCKGVVKDSGVHLSVLTDVIAEWENANFFVNGLTHSPITGGDGNIEYLLLISRSKPPCNFNVQRVIDGAFSELVGR